MPNHLIIVEFPSKARTLAKFLGAGYTVKASMGISAHLPKSKMGVDVERGFEPEYGVIRGKEKTLRSCATPPSAPSRSTWRPTPTGRGRRSPGTSLKR